MFQVIQIGLYAYEAFAQFLSRELRGVKVGFVGISNWIGTISDP